MISLLLLDKKDKPFFDEIVKGGEKWIVYDDVRRIQNWKQVCECTEALANAGLHPVKVLAFVWCDSIGEFLVSFYQSAKKVTAKEYCDKQCGYTREAITQLQLHKCLQ